MGRLFSAVRGSGVDDVERARAAEDRQVNGVSLRRVLFWMHLVTGLVIAVVVVFLALTGSTMAFAPQVTRWAERGVRNEARPADGVCVAPSALLRGAAVSAGSYGLAGRPGALAVFRDAAKPAEVSFGSDGAVLLVDGCTGRVLGTGARRTRVFFRSVQDLHHFLAWGGVRHEGLNTVKNTAVVGFVFLLLSGAVLWTPKVWTRVALRQRAVPQARGLRGRAREWNWHNVAGVWFLLPLLTISGTGTIMAWPWANGLLFRAAGEQPPTPRREAQAAEARAGSEVVVGPHGEHGRVGGIGGGGGGGERNGFARLDVPMARALVWSPGWSSVSVRLPGSGQRGGGPLQFSISNGTGGETVRRDQLTVAADGTVVKAEPYAGLSRGRRWRLWVRFLHTGELLGWPGQTVAFLSCVAALLLGWTGVSLSLRRWSAWRARGRRSAAQTRTDAGVAEAVR